MAYNPNIPQATDKLSQSQADILANFQAIEALFDGGEQEFALFIQQTSAPTTASNQLALYSQTSTTTGNLELFMRRNSNGASTELTAAGTSWTRLPSGILIKWGTGTTTQNTLATQTFPGSPAPAFSNIFTVTASQTFAASPNQSLLNNAICVGNFTTTSFQIFPRAIGLPSSSVISFCYVAIGN